LQEAGMEIDVAVRNKETITTYAGIKVVPTVDVVGIKPKNYDLLVLPGGAKALEYIRQDKDVLKTVKDFYKAGKVIASICHGAQLLISAGIMKAANTYYNLDTNTIMVDESQQMSKGLTVAGGAVSLNYNASTNTTDIGTGTTTGAVTIGGGSNTVAVNSSNWGVSSTGTISNAILSLRAGTATAGTAPLKFTAGTNLSTTEAGAIEFNGTHLYFTAANGGTRYQLDQQSGTTYTAGGTLLQLSSGQFSVKEGTLTDTKICTYSTASGLVCNTDAGAVGATYTAGNDLTLVGTQFNLNSTLNNVSTIQRASSNLTIQTTTSGTLALTSAGALNLTGTSISLDPGSGNISLAAGKVIQTSTGGAATRAKDDYILQGMVPIFGFDLPARLATSTYKQVSRTVEADPFPAAVTGTTRKYKLIIRYANDATTGTTSWSICPDATADASCTETFTVPASTTNDLNKGNDYITGDVTLASYPWKIVAKAGGTPLTLQIYQIFLAAYDKVN